MEFSAQMIAQLLGGTVDGDPKATVCDFAKIEEGRPGCLSFLANPKYAHHLADTDSTIVLINADMQVGPHKAALIRVPTAYEAIAKLMQIYQSQPERKTGISPLASVDESAEIGADVYVGPFAVVGEGARIGNGTTIHPHVVIYPG